MGTLAIIFVISVTHKLRDYGRFKASLGAYRLLPESLVGIAAPGLIGMELAAIVAILLPIGPGASIALVLLAVYTLAITINLLRGNTSIDCGCGDVPTPISGWLLLRNGALLLLVLPQQPPSGSPDVYHWLVAVALMVVLALFYLIIEQLLANHHLLVEDGR
jgi:hypothetical protein